LPYGGHECPLKERHKIENLFGRLKRFRRMATRYEKLWQIYASMIALACTSYGYRDERFIPGFP